MGAKANFNKVVRETQEQVRAYIAGMGVPIDEVDDLTQEVYLVFYRKMENLPGDLEPIRWLKGVAKRTCLDHFSRMKIRAHEHLETVAEILSDTEECCPELDTDDAASKALRNCLGKLHTKQRKLIALRYAEGMESQEVAQVVESTAEAVRIALFRIRAVLKGCIEQATGGIVSP